MHEWGTFSCNTNLLTHELYLFFVLPAFCRRGIPSSWDTFIQQTPDFLLHTKMCPAVCCAIAQLAGLCPLTVRGTTSCPPGGGLSAGGQEFFPCNVLLMMGLNSRRRPSRQQWLQCHYLSITALILIYPRFNCSQRGSRLPVGHFSFQGSPTWIPSNIAPGA